MVRIKNVALGLAVGAAIAASVVGLLESAQDVRMRSNQAASQMGQRAAAAGVSAEANPFRGRVRAAWWLDGYLSELEEE